MPKTNVNKRISDLIINGINSRHRSLFFIYGEKSKEQVLYLHHLWIKNRLKVGLQNPSILCETNKVLSQTFGMLVLQDFDGLTPNIIARTTESVEGGAFTTDRDWCSDNLEIRNDNYANITDSISNLSSSEDLKKIFQMCRTSDQLSALEKISEVIANTKTASIVSITSARGRGKSAMLGLAVASTLTSRCFRICVTSPNLENIQTVFKFLVEGLTVLNFEEGVDFNVQKNRTGSVDLITGVEVFKKCYGCVFYTAAANFQKAENAGLVVIDEAAAIPLPLVKKWLDCRTVLMASTINGYEGTGRSLSLKLLKLIRETRVLRRQ
ncbi:RNA cytidine acetyltransferase [Trichonephila clavipes]|nr:RNA cytidine acetyltransferase [Trichonephila clavipes]